MSKIVELLRKKMRQLTVAQEDLLFFTTRTKPDYRANWHHAVLAAKLDLRGGGSARG